ncbi:PIN domain-like containing protein [Sesbania bispinosa]|nr:PIN domain-like containing protein [Sesbania bispinosa]
MKWLSWEKLVRLLALITPKVGYGLASELRRWALKWQMQHLMSRGIDWLFLVLDDSNFSEMLRRAKEANLGYY